MAELFLGEDLDRSSGERNGTALSYDASDLTTHGVIVGMTGSGKTGLGVVTLEEALRNGIPTLVIDPKGDMTNLALRFPALSADDFAPWVTGGDPAEVAATWKDGLASWGLDGSHIQGLADSSTVTVYTPGSDAGVPLNLIGSMASPGTDDAEIMADEIDGLVSALLSMIDIDADPMSSPEHILLSNLVQRAWTSGAELDLGILVQQVLDPPIRKLGVLELDDFYPAADRKKLANRLNGLLASPAFGAWTRGVPLDIDSLLSTESGAACSVVYLAHLSEDERQFVVTLLLSKLITWMRSQAGTPDLRALVYMDEVFGYVPPNGAPPAKKQILTLLKQARAFGVGLVLSTQNPVDLDYKAISNAGTWMIGRLQTEQDVDRLADGLKNASGGADMAALRATIAGLGKRQFVLHTTTGSTPRLFATRWAMSYLAGPLSRDQLAALPGQRAAGADDTTSSAAMAKPAAQRPVDVGDDEVAAAPTVAEGTPVRWAAPDAPWLADVDGNPSSTTYRAGVAARVQLLFDETKADLRHTQEFEYVAVGLGDPFDTDALIAVDYDDRDLRDTAPDRIAYQIPDAPIADKRYMASVRKAIEDTLHREEVLTLRVNPELDVYSRPDETDEEFAARCAAAAEAGFDKDAAKVRKRLESKMATVRRALERAEDRASSEKQHAAISVGTDILGSLLGGKRSGGSLFSKVRRGASRAKTAKNAADRVDQKEAELDELEAELEDELASLADEWAAKVDVVEDLEVGLEKSDITIVELALVWVPV